jgi:hypothetical protein
MCDYYKNNPDKALKPRLNRKQKIRDIKNAAKDVACMDCGIKYPPYVMDFDHRGDKVFEIAGASSTFMSLEKLKVEIAKCDVVCANCHRARTHNRSTTTIRTDI